VSTSCECSLRFSFSTSRPIFHSETSTLTTSMSAIRPSPIVVGLGTRFRKCGFILKVQGRRSSCSLIFQHPFHGIPGELCAGGQLEFLFHLPTIRLDSLRAYLQLVRDLPAGQPMSDLLEDLHFTISKLVDRRTAEIGTGDERTLHDQ